MKNANKITWTSSPEFESHLIELSNKVTKELKEDSKVGGWEYEPNKDIHDDVISKLENENEIYELSRNYRRARLQQCVKPEILIEKINEE